MTITKTKFADIIFNTLYAPDLVAMLPLAIHQAYSEDNFAPLITQGSLLNAGVYDGMFYAVACTEDAPFVTLVEDANSIFGSSARKFVEVCAAWPRGQADQVLREPVVSDVPVLMLSGEVDPITPPWHAEKLSESLSNSLHLIFNNMGHGNASSDCASRIIDRFIEAGSIAGLDTSCVQAVEPPPFFVGFSGPEP
jgi:pimeloyl-ACP methyl ester carboxylesterase